MITRLYRLLPIGLMPIALIACISSGPTVAEEGAAVPVGIDLGGSGPVAALAAPGESPSGFSEHRDQMQMAHAGANDAHATGTVNSVDAAQHKINMSHKPIPSIGWPAMTMDFAVAPSVDLSRIKPGSRVSISRSRKARAACMRSSRLQPAGAGQ